MRRTARVLLLAVGLLAAGAAAAEVLLIEALRQDPPNAPGGLERPVRGMTMAEVERRFGAPKVKHPPVGDPPITRWDYDRFSVFFEHQYVLHSVVHRTRTAAAGR
ncbi:MAG TPA: hypothetical protein ENK20_06635 [Chromatiales bacterium]|nr:hypothetical protein [Chromatiales bacterium]